MDKSKHNHMKVLDGQLGQLPQRPISKIFSKKYWELAELKISFFELAILIFFSNPETTNNSWLLNLNSQVIKSYFHCVSEDFFFITFFSLKKIKLGVQLLLWHFWSTLLLKLGQNFKPQFQIVHWSNNLF